jgi:hypothetical protein
MIAARAGVIFFFLLASMVVGGSLRRSEAADSWQVEWEKTVKAAEAEGQVSLYVAGYGKVIDSGEFQKAYPKIKVVSVSGSGAQLSNRIGAERRADKFLADVYNGGGNSLYQVLFLNKILDPINPRCSCRKFSTPPGGGRANTSTPLVLRDKARRQRLAVQHHPV